MEMGLLLRQTYLYSYRPSGLPAKKTLSVYGECAYARLMVK